MLLCVKQHAQDGRVHMPAPLDFSQHAFGCCRVVYAHDVLCKHMSRGLWLHPHTHTPCVLCGVGLAGHSGPSFPAAAAVSACLPAGSGNGIHTYTSIHTWASSLLAGCVHLALGELVGWAAGTVCWWLSAFAWRQAHRPPLFFPW